eukprot:gnl/MRDRNA2_/MRDRNA2_80301_c0_seq4.p1 gnl/MRDRNA2_/MRDRNA2_80301_c0~~gnl/MRDRNA2_/MRDRNA2_80301_c0_seq4.p1  ORF type:complete len:242 (+),score=30.89 gnl/MRDRNA2_/MRDRNA2_80301_c0_seq4:81-806(+)
MASVISLPLATVVSAAILDRSTTGLSKYGSGSPQPGTSIGCWRGSMTYKRCCLDDAKGCWPPDELEVRMLRCCTAFLEVQQQLKNLVEETPNHMVTPTLGAPPALVRCARGGGDGTELRFALNSSSIQKLSANNMLKACECIARLLGVNVILDLFLGGGGTVNAFARGLSRQADRTTSNHRPPEIFTFEQHKAVVYNAFTNGGILEKWNPEIASIESYDDYMNFQRFLTSPQDQAITITTL